MTSRDTSKEKVKERPESGVLKVFEEVCERFFDESEPSTEKQNVFGLLENPLIMGNGGGMVCKAFLTSLTFSTHSLPVDDKRKHLDRSKIHSYLNILALNAHPDFSLSFR